MASQTGFGSGSPDARRSGRAALVVISVFSLIAAIVALVACVLLLVAVMHLDADIQSLGNAPAQSGAPVLIP